MPSYDEDLLFEFADITTFSRLPVRTGLQPKEIAEFDGSTWMVKHDPLNVSFATLNEWMTMQLMRAAGFETSDYGLGFIECAGKKRAAIFVKYFDLLEDFTQQLVSGIQLVHESPTVAYRIESVLEKSTKEEFNIVLDSMLGELTLFDAINVFGEAGVINLEEVFRFYVAAEMLNHSDCHLGNIGFVRNLETGEYRVSPVYDVGNFGPYDEARTILPTASHGHFLDRDNLKELARKCGVTNWEDIVDRMADDFQNALPDVLKQARSTSWMCETYMQVGSDLRGPADFDEFLEKYETTLRSSIAKVINSALAVETDYQHVA